MDKKLTYKELQVKVEKLKKEKDVLFQKNKKLEEEQLSEIHFLNILMDTIPYRIYFKDKKGKFIKINNRLAQKHNIKNTTDAIGKTDFNFFKKEHAQKAYNDEQNIIKTGKQIENLIEKETWNDGSITWASTTKMPLISIKNEIIGTFGITKDITDRIKAEKKIQKQYEQLKELNATKDKFFSIIAHDLIGPFNTMLGFSDLLVNKFEKFDVQKQKKFISFISENIQNTFKLLENLLLWSRSQRDIIKFNPKEINFYLLSNEVVDLLNQTAKNKSITIKNEIPKNIIVKADKNMLATIIRNLISNAIKFTPKGGIIEIGVETRRGVSLQHGVSLHEIYVKDTGIGINKENQAKLFKIEDNISTKGTNNEAGTGLGLILCKEFVGKHGGKIWVESKEGKGSKFIFTLPVI